MTKKTIISSSLIFLLSLIPTLAMSTSTLHSKIDYYLVSGSTGNEIRRDMNKKRPGNFDAYTTWNIRWNYRWYQSNGSCYMTSVNTNVDVAMILPQLKNSRSQSAALKSRWNSYMRALIRHENGHKKIATKTAVAVENKVLAMGARGSCGKLKIAADKIAYKVIKNFVAKEKRFDKKTRNGMNNGVVFP